VNEEQLERAMTFIGNRFVEIIRESLEQNYPYAPGYNGGRKVEGQSFKRATGNLYESVGAVYDPPTQTLGIVMLNYWKWVNQGRQPGSMPPVSPLIKWAELKGFPNPEKAAWGIATNIKKFGIAPTGFFSTIATDKLIEEFDEYITEQFAISVEEFFDRLRLPE
jgi:hypothetical protein